MKWNDYFVAREREHIIRVTHSCWLHHQEVLNVWQEAVKLHLNKPQSLPVSACVCFFLSLSVCLIVCVSLPGFVCFSPFRPFSSGEQEKILFEWNYVTRDPRWHDLLSEFPAGFYFHWGRALRRDVSIFSWKERGWKKQTHILKKYFSFSQASMYLKVQ